MNLELPSKPEGAPEWMVSYADMITIIMSFFVIMFALASGELKKGKRSKPPPAIESLQYRFGPAWKPFSNWSLAPGNSDTPGHPEKTRGTMPLAPIGDPGGTLKVVEHERARIRVPGRGDHIAIGGLLTFDEGSTSVTDKQRAWLKAIADEMKGMPQHVEVVGFASDRALTNGSHFDDRWDLAFARCREAAKLLSAMQIEPSRIQLSVVPASEPSLVKPSAVPSDDGQVQVYLSERYSGQ